LKLNPEAEARYRLQEYGGARAIEGVELVELRRLHDDGGSLTELVRLAGAGEARALAGFRVAQVNYACVQPGVVKAFHLHHRQTDVWFVPPEDRVLLVLIDVRADSPSAGTLLRTMLGDGASGLVRIPPGVAHGCRNLGRRPARIVYFTDLHFSPEPDRSDEGRLPWDFAGREVWDVRWE
jgi:dTDP-4-dehydrorhamnose 3,5-epimerase